MKKNEIDEDYSEFEVDEPESPFGDEPTPPETFDEIPEDDSPVEEETRVLPKNEDTLLKATHGYYKKMFERLQEDAERKSQKREDEFKFKISEYDNRMKVMMEELEELKKRTAIPAENLSSSAAVQERVLKLMIKAFGLDESSSQILNGRKDPSVVAQIFNTYGANIRRLRQEKDALNDSMTEGAEDDWNKIREQCEKELEGRPVSCFTKFVDMSYDIEKKFEKDEEKAEYCALAMAALSRMLFGGIPNPIIEEVEQFSE